jgi:hypothetical protein
MKFVGGSYDGSTVDYSKPSPMVLYLTRLRSGIVRYHGSSGDVVWRLPEDVYDLVWLDYDGNKEYHYRHTVFYEPQADGQQTKVLDNTLPLWV